MSESKQSWLRSLVDFLIRFRLVLLPVALGLLVVAWPTARHLSLEQSIESLYAENDIHLRNYRQSRSFFGGDEFVLVAYSDPDLFVPGRDELAPESVERIRKLVERLNQIPGVRAESTQDLASSLSFRYRRDRVRKLLEGVLVGSDQQTTAVVLRLKNGQSDAQRARTIAQIRAIAAAQSVPTYVAGEPVQVYDMFRYVDEDGALLFRVSLVLLAAVIILLFRSPRWVILPLLVVMASIVWTEAILVLSRMKLSMVSSMLNSLVTIIGIATVMHVTVHFREYRRHMSRVDALHHTLVELVPVIFWTCATTAAGFGALLSSDITPVRSFGTMMALATMLVLAAAATALPGGILIGTLSADPRSAPAERQLVGLLGGLTERIERRPRFFSIASALLFAFAALGLLRLDVETDFSKNFRRSSPIVQSLEFVEQRLGGAGTWEVNFSAPHELTEEFLERVGELAHRLRSEVNAGDRPQLTKVICLADGLDLVPRLPILTNTLEKRLQVLKGFHPEFESSLYNREQGRMRIVLRAFEQQQSAEKLRLITDVQRLAHEEFPDAKATGLFVLLAFLIDSLLSDQLVSFAWAAAGIGSMMTIAFGSVRIGLISLVPNVFPIVLVVGAMGWIGLPINIGTAMIASVSMGLTVDSSIHYLAGYRRARQRGLTIAEALSDTHRNVGRALVFATFALMVGFSVLTLSHFIPLVYFGILVSAAMLGGLIGNLILLPLLLKFEGKSNKA